MHTISNYELLTCDGKFLVLSKELLERIDAKFAKATLTANGLELIDEENTFVLKNIPEASQEILTNQEFVELLVPAPKGWGAYYIPFSSDR
ncbi:hypothetical protein [Neptuniibacter sp. QD37_11]|uniref:hypothetical protein n=1 Tax=Neptuniibacter sp. QD37_11 TaxID=3398209 RepID=UPI0039F498DE